jgi:ribulose 1,5-bisphosphate carboxylase large subunit-like protein
MASGGLHPGLVPSLLNSLGTDIGVQAGGGVHATPTEHGRVQGLSGRQLRRQRRADRWTTPQLTVPN